MGRFTPQDKYFQKAKALGLRARSAFKLEEIQEKFRLVKAGHAVADLGAAPGSFAQMLSKWVGPKGNVVAVDLTLIEPIAHNVEIHQANITDYALMEKIFEGIGEGSGQRAGSRKEGAKTPRKESLLDGVVADLAPKTSGIHDADAYHSAELNHAVLNFCEHFLKSGGYCVTKIFQGEEFSEVVARAKKLFKTAKCFKPQACRDSSREMYIVGTGFRGLVDF